MSPYSDDLTSKSGNVLVKETLCLPPTLTLLQGIFLSLSNHSIFLLPSYFIRSNSETWGHFLNRKLASALTRSSCQAKDINTQGKFSFQPSLYYMIYYIIMLQLFSLCRIRLHMTSIVHNKMLTNHQVVVIALSHYHII